MQISVRADTKYEVDEKGKTIKKTPKSIVTKTVIESSWKRLRKSQIQKNFNFKHDSNVKNSLQITAQLSSPTKRSKKKSFNLYPSFISEQVFNTRSKISLHLNRIKFFFPQARNNFLGPAPVGPQTSRRNNLLHYYHSKTTIAVTAVEHQKTVIKKITENGSVGFQ